MTKADEVFEQLGYRKWENEFGIMYMKDLFMITFITRNRTLITEYKRGDHNFPEIRPFELSMQELKAINKKCNELGWL